MLRSILRGVLVLPLALLSCTPAADSLLEPIDGRGLQIQPSLIPSAADATALTIHRIRTVTTEASTGALLSEDSFDVSPQEDEWEIEITVPGFDQVTVVVLLLLVHVDAAGDEQVQFSGRSEPITVQVGEPATPEVPFVRGPLANLLTTGVTITAAPATVREGESGGVQASAETSGTEAPAIFWTSLDPDVLTVDGSTVTGVTIGTAQVVASAGAHADTVTIEVLTSDVTPPMITDRSPGPGAVAVSPATTVAVTFDEDIDPASVDGTTVYLRDVQGANVAATLSTSANVVTLTPDAPLDSLTTYTATVGAVADLVGNVFPDPASWSFTTASSAFLVSSFNPDLGTLVAIAYEAEAEQLYIYDDFADSIFVYTTAGARVGAGLPRAGISSNDIDLDFTEVATTIGSTVLPNRSLLVHNGESSPGTIYGVDRVTGAILDSLALQTTGQPVGGSVHSQRGTFFSLSWDNDVVHEVEYATGAALATFSPAPVGSPGFGIFYGDLDVDPVTGHLIIVSSQQATIRVLTATGAFVRDVDVASLGIVNMSGIAWDAANRIAWISTTTGVIYAVGGVL